MNSELKPLLKEAYDLVVLGEDVVAKKYTSLIADGIQAGEDVPAVVSNWTSLKTDLEALVSSPAADADVLAYVGSLMGGQGPAVAGLVAALASTVLLSVQQYTAVKAAIAALNPPAAAPAAPAAPVTA